MVREERTAAGVSLPAGKTPRGARPNRGGGAARPARLPGRSLESDSNVRPRRMTAARKGTETGLQSGSLQPKVTAWETPTTQDPRLAWNFTANQSCFSQRANNPVFFAASARQW